MNSCVIQSSNVSNYKQQVVQHSAWWIRSARNPKHVDLSQLHHGLHATSKDNVFHKPLFCALQWNLLKLKMKQS